MQIDAGYQANWATCPLVAAPLDNDKIDLRPAELVKEIKEVSGAAGDRDWNRASRTASRRLRSCHLEAKSCCMLLEQFNIKGR